MKTIFFLIFSSFLLSYSLSPLDIRLNPDLVLEPVVVQQPIRTFNEFTKKFNLNFATPELLYREQVFNTNLKLADTFNEEQIKLGGQPAFGVTMFSALTLKEFQDRYLMKIDVDADTETEVLDRATPPTGVKIGDVRLVLNELNSTLDTEAEVQQNYDWSAYVTPVKNQRNCGTCWAFAAAETIESFAKIKGLGLQRLSVQQAASCSKSNPCNGGWTKDVYKYLEPSTRYLYGETSNPYDVNTVGNGCDVSVTKPPEKIPIYGYKHYKPTLFPWFFQDVVINELNNALKLGPVASYFRADKLQVYTGGIIQGSSCTGDINHAIQVVAKSGTNDKPLYKIRNSWGAGWGESGYFRLQINKNLFQDNCAIGGTISYPLISSFPYGADQCKSGYVWREAVPGDHVCVTSATRTQAQQDNAMAPYRKEPNGGPYGPNTCKQGYVWREATKNIWKNQIPFDYVCVLPSIRSSTAYDNTPSVANSRWIIPH